MPNAGTPSADAFGPRHALVRIYPIDMAIQEFVDDSGVWTPVGDPHDLPGIGAPNLTPSGLDMVYDDAFGLEPGVYIAHRSSIDEWFGPPAVILPGKRVLPQLLGGCRTLYATDISGEIPTLRRYDR